MNPPLWRRFAAALLFLSSLFVGLPLLGCDEKSSGTADPKVVEQVLQLEANQHQLMEKNSTLSFGLGLLLVLVFLAVFIGAGWGSLTRKEKEK